MPFCGAPSWLMFTLSGAAPSGVKVMTALRSSKDSLAATAKLRLSLATALESILLIQSTGISTV